MGGRKGTSAVKEKGRKLWQSVKATIANFYGSNFIWVLAVTGLAWQQSKVQGNDWQRQSWVFLLAELVSYGLE